MIGARQAGGSAMLNGGANSSLNCVIAALPSLNPALQRRNAVEKHR
jgi:hypothetical protein